MRATIITIGDEILIGQIVDTNSAWMATQLNLHGIAIHEIISVSDKSENILNALERAEAQADIVLITGGLGPTKDDITKHTLCEYFDTHLVWHEEVWQHLIALFQRFGREPSDTQRGQAEQPEAATILLNKVGTAPGIWFERNHKVIAAMPGVPFEMQYLMSNEILPRLSKMAGGMPIEHRTLLTAGIGESDLAKIIEVFENSLPDFVKLAYLPALGNVRLRLTGSHHDAESLRQRIDSLTQELASLIEPHLYGFDEDTLENAVQKLFIAQKRTLGTAESCTGGAIAAAIVSVDGASRFFQGSIIPYQNTLKAQLLSVNPETIATHGAVSQETVEEMARNTRNALACDVSIAVSGIAGPNGGTDSKPVGTIWYAIADGQQVVSKKLKFGRDRKKNIQLTVTAVLFDLYRFLKTHP